MTAGLNTRMLNWALGTLFVVLIAVDQLLKSWALNHLNVSSPTIVVIPGLVGWKLLVNTGAAWGMFSNLTTPLAVGRLLVGLGIVYYLFRKPQSLRLSIFLTMIAAGAIGNSIDGLRLGRVTDMLQSPLLDRITQAINGSPFPIFNLADCFVVLGTILLVLASYSSPPNSVVPEQSF